MRTTGTLAFALWLAAVAFAQAQPPYHPGVAPPAVSGDDQSFEVTTTIVVRHRQLDSLPQVPPPSLLPRALPPLLPTPQPVPQVPPPSLPPPAPPPLLTAPKPVEPDPVVTNPAVPPQPVEIQEPEPLTPRPTPPPSSPIYVWARGEFLMWWLRPGHTPPLATAGTNDSLGILGRPGTVVLYGGDVDDDLRLGARVTLGAWVDTRKCLGFEVPFLFLFQHEGDFAASTLGTPVLARPFIDAVTGAAVAEQVANPALPGILPLEGEVAVQSRSRLWGIDPSLLAGCCLSCESRLDLMGGFRYLSLHEGLLITESLHVPESSPQFPGNRFLLADDFATRNDFFGGQVGARWSWHKGPLDLELLGKVGLGAVREQVIIKGATTTIPAGAVPQTLFVGGLLAQPTNIGDHDRTRFAVLPEVGARVGLRVAAGVKVSLGYSLIYLNNVVRPGDQIDLAVNTSQLPPGTLVGPARPAFRFHSTDFWAQGLNLGLELGF